MKIWAWILVCWAWFFLGFLVSALMSAAKEADAVYERDEERAELDLDEARKAGLL